MFYYVALEPALLQSQNHLAINYNFISKSTGSCGHWKNVCCNERLSNRW